MAWDEMEKRDFCNNLIDDNMDNFSYKHFFIVIYLIRLTEKEKTEMTTK